MEWDLRGSPKLAERPSVPSHPLQAYLTLQQIMSILPLMYYHTSVLLFCLFDQCPGQATSFFPPITPGVSWKHSRSPPLFPLQFLLRGPELSFPALYPSLPTLHTHTQSSIIWATWFIREGSGAGAGCKSGFGFWITFPAMYIWSHYLAFENLSILICTMRLRKREWEHLPGLCDLSAGEEWLSMNIDNLQSPPHHSQRLDCRPHPFSLPTFNHAEWVVSSYRTFLHVQHMPRKKNAVFLLCPSRKVDPGRLEKMQIYISTQDTLPGTFLLTFS